MSGIPIYPAPNPANWKTLGDYWQPPTPEQMVNLEGATMRNRLASMQMQDEMDYRNALLQGTNNGGPVNQQPFLDQTRPPVQMADASGAVPIPGQEQPPVQNALSQPMTYGAYKARKEMAAERVQQMEQYSKGIANLRKLYGPKWKMAYKQMEPDLMAMFPMARNVNIDSFVDSQYGTTYEIKGPDGRSTGKMAFIDDSGKTHIVDAEPKANEKFDRGNLTARAIRGDEEARRILDEMDRRELDITKQKGAGTDRARMGKEASDLRKQFYGNPVVKDYNDVAGKFKLMEKALEESKTSKNNVAIDQALITLFNKMTDPSSVVRESEYARTSGDIAFVNRIKGKAEKIMKGGAGLTIEERQALTNMGKNFYNIYQSRYLEKEDEYRGYATLQGVNPDLVIRPLSKSKAAPGMPQASERNNNPLNLKVGNGTKKYIVQGIATEGSEATDGGKFLKFNSPEEGLKAAKEWLTSGPYQGLTVHQAMLKWSNKGYGGNIAPQIADKKIASLTPQEQDLLIQRMLKAEGSGSVVAPSSPEKPTTPKASVNQAMSAMPPASQHKGRTIKGSDNSRWKSDGTKWVKLG